MVFYGNSPNMVLSLCGSFLFLNNNQFSQNVMEFKMKKYFGLAIILLFSNVTQAAVYMIDFKCEPEAYEVFGSMTLAELDAEFLPGSTKLARYHDLTPGSGIVLVEADDPTLVMEFAYGWNELCESAIVPVLDDAGVMEIVSK